MPQDDEADRKSADPVPLEAQMPPRKPYVLPQLFRVELNQEQAILTACSLFATNMSNGGNRTCRTQGAAGCKNHGSRAGDSGPRPS